MWCGLYILSLTVNSLMWCGLYILSLTVNIDVKKTLENEIIFITFPWQEFLSKRFQNIPKTKKKGIPCNYF